MSSSPRHSAPKEGEPKAPARVKARPRRRWPRRTLIAANLLSLAAIAAGATAYAYVEHIINNITVGPGKHEVGFGQGLGGGRLAPSQARSHDGLDAENILLIGNQTRLGLTPEQQRQYGSSLIYTGTLADIIMVLHLDPVNDTASLLSVPRDLFSPMPAGSPVGPYQKIDAALNDGKSGPDNLVAAIEQDYGIPVNGYIELNFNGFINSVDALGGIKVYFPEPVWDAESLLWIPKSGCWDLNGTQSLALVRARHLQYDPPGDTEPRSYWPYDPESDLARIVRTHTFMKIVAQTAIRDGKTDPLSAASFLDAISTQIVVNQALKSQLLKLVTYYRHVNINKVQELTLPVSGVPNTYYYGGYGVGSVIFPVQPADNRVIQRWDPQVFQKEAPPSVVNVVSLTGSTYAAEEAGSALATHGLKIGSETAGTVPGTPSETLVVYPPKGLSHALYVMKFLSGAVMLEESSSVPAGTVQLDVGSLLTVSARPTTTTTIGGTAGPGGGGGTSTTAATTTSTSPSTTAPRATSLTSVATAATTTTVPTPDGVVSASGDSEQPWDPRACPSH